MADRAELNFACLWPIISGGADRQRSRFFRLRKAREEDSYPTSTEGVWAPIPSVVMNEPFLPPTTPPPLSPPPLPHVPPLPPPQIWPPVSPPTPRYPMGVRPTDSGILFRRWFARLIDGLILSPFVLFAYYRYVLPIIRDYLGEIVVFFEGPATGQPPEPPLTMFSLLPFGYYALIGGSLILYQFLSYYLAGASPGKLLLSLVVVDEQGKSIKGDALIALKRAGAEALLLLPGFGQLVGILNSVLVLIKENRSIYDRAATTRVVRRS